METRDYRGRRMVWIVQGYKHRSTVCGESYEHLYLTFLRAGVGDAAADVKHAAETGYYPEEALTRCKAIRAATDGGTRYYDSDSETGFTLKFQRNYDAAPFTDSDKWYCFTLDGSRRVSDAVVRGLSAIAKATNGGRTANPDACIKALSAVSVAYCNDASKHVPTPGPVDTTDRAPVEVANDPCQACGLADGLHSDGCRIFNPSNPEAR